MMHPVGRFVREEAATLLNCPNCHTDIALPTSVGASWTIRAPRDVADRMMTQIGHLEREELWVLGLNTKNRVLFQERVYQGNLSSSVVRVGELFRKAVHELVAGVILVHNHPSGDPTPSPDDLHLTAEALAAGRLLDIDLLDHLIVTPEAYVSLRDRGVSFDRPARR